MRPSALFDGGSFRALDPNSRKSGVVHVPAQDDAEAIATTRRHERIAGGVQRAIDLGVVDELIDPAITRSAIAEATHTNTPSNPSLRPSLVGGFVRSYAAWVVSLVGSE